MTPAEATHALERAIMTVSRVRVYAGLGRTIVPPAVVVGPPALEFDGFCNNHEPTLGTWNVYLVTSLTEFATEQLLALVGPVCTVIANETPAVVVSAIPGLYPSTHQGDLPSYLIEVTMEL